MPALSPRIIASMNLAFACSIACLTAATSTTGRAAVAAESFTGVSRFGAHAAANRATAAHSGATTRIGRHLRADKSLSDDARDLWFRRRVGRDRFAGSHAVDYLTVPYDWRSPNDYVLHADAWGERGTVRRLVCNCCRVENHDVGICAFLKVARTRCRGGPC